jgi:hypothetical protein
MAGPTILEPEAAIPPMICTAALALLALGAGPEPADGTRYERRWFYASHNLQVAENADRLVGLIERASKAGYNGVVLADYKLSILDRVPDHYFKNAARVRDAAKKAGIEIVPAVFPIGYSAGLLSHDPNLAEGLTVEDAPFVVRGREATLAADPEARLVNGDLEQTKGDQFVGFSFQDDPGRATVADREVKHGGAVSCRIGDTARTSTSGNGRLVAHVKVRPHACYRFSAWVKTKDLKRSGDFRLLALGEGGRALTFFEGGIEPTQDWKRVEVVFNSLDRRAVNLYAGLWGGAEGTLWIDDLKLEELALVNVLRRDGCPLLVASADGKTSYVEGKDFEPVADPKLGRVPYAGEYEFDHRGAALRLTPGSRIKDGQRLRVSWYHPVLTHGTQVMCCLSEPKVYDLLRDQARRVEELFHPKSFFMSHDEIRVANWCRACRSRGMTPGRLLADNARRCVQILREVSPRAEAVVWSDMFDPNHNAVKDYYLVDGTLAGSWEGLAPGVVVANWNGGKAAASLAFFAKRGHRQVIAGYYDAGPESFARWDAAARGVPGVIGFMYTTWQSRYGDLEEYGRLMRGGR